MKILKLFLTVIFLGASTVSFAQFANTGSSIDANTDGWSGLRVSYHPISLSGYVDYLFSDKIGASVGFVKGISISKDVPLFLEVGGNVLWSKISTGDDYDGDYDEYDEYNEYKINIFSVNLPVSFGYKIAVSEGFSFYPFFGANFRYNISGKTKDSDSDESFDVFSEDDIDGLGWKRFQAGWHIGMACNISKFVISAIYEKDFSDISKGVRISMPTISLGYNF